MNASIDQKTITYEFTIQECNYLVNALFEMQEDREQEPLAFMQLPVIKELRRKIYQKMLQELNVDD